MSGGGEGTDAGREERKRGNKKREEPTPRLSTVIRDLTPQNLTSRSPQQPPPRPPLETPSAIPDGPPFLWGPCPQPPSTVGGAAASRGSQAPGRQACSAAGMHGPGRAAQARGPVPAGVPGCRGPPSSLARCRRASALSLRAWPTSSPHLRHPWRGLPRDSPRASSPGRQGPTWPSSGSLEAPRRAWGWS